MHNGEIDGLPQKQEKQNQHLVFTELHRFMQECKSVAVHQLFICLHTFLLSLRKYLATCLASSVLPAQQYSTINLAVMLQMASTAREYNQLHSQILFYNSHQWYGSAMGCVLQMWSKSRRFDSRLGSGCIKTLGNHKNLCVPVIKQSFGTSQWAMTFSSLKLNTSLSFH